MVHSDVALDGHASRTKSSAVEQIAHLLLSQTHVNLPAVVVVEDIHLMGPELGQLIDRLSAARSDKPLLVIGTAWPEGRENEDYKRWRVATTERGLLAELPMPVLETNARVEILRQAAPSTSEPDAMRVVERYPNPLALKILLSLQKIGEAIKDANGALILSDEELSELPQDIHDLYRQRWKELPEPVQDALVISAGGLPITNSPGSWPFLREVISDAAARCGLLDSVDVPSFKNFLESAENPYHWHISLGDPADAITSFQEAVLGDIAVLALRDRFRPRQIALLQDATVAVLSEWIDRERRDGYLLNLTERSRIATRLLWELTANRSELTVAVAVAGLTVARTQANAFQYGEAIRTLSERDWQSPLAPDHTDTLRTRNNLAYWLGRAGLVEEAISRFEELVVDYTRVLGPDAPDTLRTRHNLASLLGEAGRVEEAISRFEELVVDYTRVLDPDAPDTLRTRNNLASLLGEAGRVEEAISRFEELVVDYTRVLGPDAPDTLRTRNNLAYWLGRAGLVEEAISRFEELVVDYTRVLGPDAPDTLTTRNNLASLLGEAGRVEEADGEGYDD